MWTYLAKFLAYNTIGLKNYTKTYMTRNWFQSILLIMLLWRILFFIQVLVWELLYYISFLFSWKHSSMMEKKLFSYLYILSFIGSQFLWFNNYFIIDNNSVHFQEFSSHNVNFFNPLFTSEGELEDWNYINWEFQLNNNLYYKFTQISNAIPRKWKQELRENRAETCTIYLDHGLTKTNYFSD